LDRTGLLDKIPESALLIATGRNGQNTDGIEHEGRVNYESGLSLALAAFKKVQENAGEDLGILILAEDTFVRQEFALCDPKDTDAISSSTTAMNDIGRAFIALKVLESKSGYKFVEQAISDHSKFRYKGMVKDAFHVACSGHWTRLGNSLKTHGVSLLEKKLIKQRCANLRTAQAIYLKKQKQVLGMGTMELNEAKVQTSMEVL
jgi:hypothetical protein